jgi:voltage-gated potassium channel
MPDKIGGEHMASLVVLPDFVEFVDRLTISTEGSANLKEIHINDLPSEFLNKTILDLDLRKKTGCTVIGFKTASNEYIINPEAKTKLTLDSNLIVLGRPSQIQQLTQIL